MWSEVQRRRSKDVTHSSFMVDGLELMLLGVAGMIGWVLIGPTLMPRAPGGPGGETPSDGSGTGIPVLLGEIERLRAALQASEREKQIIFQQTAGLLPSTPGVRAIPYPIGALPYESEEDRRRRRRIGGTYSGTAFAPAGAAPALFVSSGPTAGTTGGTTARSSPLVRAGGSAIVV